MNMIFVASEKKNSTAKKRDIAPFKVNGQSHIILQQLSYFCYQVAEKNILEGRTDRQTEVKQYTSLRGAGV
jgi:hypothetical protein